MAVECSGVCMHRMCGEVESSSSKQKSLVEFTGTAAADRSKRPNLADSNVANVNYTVAVKAKTLRSSWTTLGRSHGELIGGDCRGTLTVRHGTKRNTTQRAVTLLRKEVDSCSVGAGRFDSGSKRSGCSLSQERQLIWRLLTALCSSRF